jgi:hypothetical protein
LIDLVSSLRSGGWIGLLVAQFLIAPAGAWEDAPLMWEANGEISGLPDGFERASLMVRFASGPRPRVDEVVLELASKRISLPACVLKHLKSERKEDVQVMGSLQPGMEPSLVLYFFAPRESIEPMFEGAFVSFGIRNAELSHVVTGNGRGGKEIELSASCRSDLRKRTLALAF